MRRKTTKGRMMDCVKHAIEWNVRLVSAQSSEDRVKAGENMNYWLNALIFHASSLMTEPSKLEQKIRSEMKSCSTCKHSFYGDCGSFDRMFECRTKEEDHKLWEKR